MKRKASLDSIHLGRMVKRHFSGRVPYEKVSSKRNLKTSGLAPIRWGANAGEDLVILSWLKTLQLPELKALNGRLMSVDRTRITRNYEHTARKAVQLEFAWNAFQADPATHRQWLLANARSTRMATQESQLWKSLRVGHELLVEFYQPKFESRWRAVGHGIDVHQVDPEATLLPGQPCEVLERCVGVGLARVMGFAPLPISKPCPGGTGGEVHVCRLYCQLDAIKTKACCAILGKLTEVIIPPSRAPCLGCRSIHCPRLGQCPPPAPGTGHFSRSGDRPYQPFPGARFEVDLFWMRRDDGHSYILPQVVVLPEHRQRRRAPRMTCGMQSERPVSIVLSPGRGLWLAAARDCLFDSLSRSGNGEKSIVEIVLGYACLDTATARERKPSFTDWDGMGERLGHRACWLDCISRLAKATTGGPN